MAQSDWQSEMRKGVAEMYVLAALSDEAVYGYRVIQILERFETLRMRESTLYLILARLEREELVSVKKIASDKGPKRKYFSLTPAGRERLANMRGFWRMFSTNVEQFLERDGGDDKA